MNYTQHYSTTGKTPVTQKADESQIVNSSGGFVFGLDDWKRLDRFLILGSEGGSYYASERKLTVANAKAVERCIKADGVRVVNQVVAISDAGRAPKNDPALFALAMCAGLGNDETRKAALEALPKVARIGTHLFHFTQFVLGFRKWGRGLRKAISSWYSKKSINDLCYQLIKYQQRDGWSHADLMKLAHIKSNNDKDVKGELIYRWVIKGEWGKPIPKDLTDQVAINELLEINKTPMPPLLQAFEDVKKATTVDEVVKLITNYGLPREAIPTTFLNEVKVWEALLPTMPLTALIRNLGKMTAVGLIKPQAEAVKVIVAKLGDKEYIQKSRLHPLSILVALRQYSAGKGDKGSLTWDAHPKVLDALNEAFYLSFGNVEKTGKRIMLGLDVSGSMSHQIAGMPITAREAVAALSLITARIEDDPVIMGFASGFIPLKISARQRLDDVMNIVHNIDFDTTDCSKPIKYALEKGLKIDTFIIMTDNETNRGEHPYKVLQEYRKKTGIAAKMIVVGTEANNFSVADPNDSGMLDVVGFDTATPNIMADFMRE